MKKLRFLILLPLFSVNTLFILMGGCFSKNAPSCGYFTKASLSAWNNADSTPQPAQTAGVIAKAMYLELQLTDTIYTCFARPGLVAPNAAYAIRIEPYVQFANITRVSIISNHDFDKTHPAGTELKDLFYHQGYTDTIGKHAALQRYKLLYAPDDTGTHTFTRNLERSYVLYFYFQLV